MGGGGGGQEQEGKLEREGNPEIGHHGLLCIVLFCVWIFRHAFRQPVLPPVRGRRSDGRPQNFLFRFVTDLFLPSSLCFLTDI